VNGKLVYTDKNLFEQEGARKAPDGRCSLDNGVFTLPLEAGEGGTSGITLPAGSIVTDCLGFVSM